MSDVRDWNKQVIEEFRANGGKLSGGYEGASLLLLTTTGAKSGKERVTPLAYFVDGDRLIVVASKRGAPNHPDWYHNLVAHPEVKVEVGTETFHTTATTLEGEERERIRNKIAESTPTLDEHQANTTRQIPLVALKR